MADYFAIRKTSSTRLRAFGFKVPSQLVENGGGGIRERAWPVCAWETARERATESLLILNYLAVNELSTGQNPHMAAAVPWLGLVQFSSPLPISIISRQLMADCQRKQTKNHRLVIAIVTQPTTGNLKRIVPSSRALIPSSARVFRERGRQIGHITYNLTYRQSWFNLRWASIHSVVRRLKRININWSLILYILYLLCMISRWGRENTAIGVGNFRHVVSDQ